MPSGNRCGTNDLSRLRSTNDITSTTSSTVRQPFPVIVDLTFGNGAHSRAILEEFKDDRNLVLFAMDRDPKAVELAEVLKREDARTVVPIHAK